MNLTSGQINSAAIFILASKQIISLVLLKENIYVEFLFATNDINIPNDDTYAMVVLHVAYYPDRYVFE